MRLTDALLGEHAIFYSMLDHLERVVAENRPVAEIKSLVAMLEAALTVHAQVENDQLFPVLARDIGPMGPIEVMRREHAEIEETLGRISGIEDAARIEEPIGHLVAVARTHFEKEERVLFPLAQRRLGDETLSGLATKWAEVRGVALVELA